MRTLLLAFSSWLLCSLFAPSAGSAQAAGTLVFDQLNQYLACQRACLHGKLALRPTCLAECGAPEPGWDKNADSQLDRIDYDLAVAELAGDTCVRNGAMMHIDACQATECAQTHTPAECADQDRDGLVRFQEDSMGTLDACASPQACALARNDVCQTGADCEGFREQCSFALSANRRLCRARQCSGPACTATAFHLEQVSADNSEVIIHLFYDYSPTPARVLDLYVDYDPTQLALVDARPLAALRSVGKEVRTSHNASQKLRVMVLGGASTLPIPTDQGAIVELVFSRLGTSATNVDFLRGPAASGARVRALAPDEGSHNPELASDALWGSRVPLAVTSPGQGDRLALYYSFDNSRKPLDFPSTDSGALLSGASLCGLIASCANEPELAQKDVLTARYDTLQRGVVEVEVEPNGVSGPAAGLRGTTQHLELPLFLRNNAATAANPLRAAQQDMSLSLWVFHDPSRGRGGEPEVVYSHNSNAEQTAYGLAALPRDAGVFQIAWFTGDILSSTPGAFTTTALATLPVRTWVHVGLTVSAATGGVQVYIDGRPSSAPLAVVGPPLSCPQFEPSLRLHFEGENGVGVTPSQVFLATSQSNLYGVRSMDANGLGLRDVITAKDSSRLDPDYNPSLDKLVYVSTESGSYEIWMANGDGSNPVQITRGFGDTANGVFARRPRWAPDSSAIVFESNVYSTEYRHNIYGNTSHLYYVAFDASQKKVAIPNPSGGTSLTQLVFDDLGKLGVLDQYRLTKSSYNHGNAQWIKAGSAYRILMTRSGKKFENRHVAVVTPEGVLTDVDAQSVELPASVRGSDVSLLAAYSVEQAGVTMQRQLLKRERIHYQPGEGVSVTTSSPSPGVVRATVRYTGRNYAPSCHDLDGDASVCDEELEDRNGDGRCNIADCHPFELRELYVDYTSTSLTPAKGNNGQVTAALGPDMAGLGKGLRAQEQSTSGRKHVRLELLSELNRRPLTPGQILATVDFQGTGSALSLRERVVEDDLFITSLLGDGSATRFDLNRNEVEEVLSAAFSPDGQRLLLSGLSKARPVLVTTSGLTGTGTLSKVSAGPVRVEGLSWKAFQRVYPCNWLGAHRDRRDGTLRNALRGGLDEVKLYTYVRQPLAFASDAERGHESLARHGTPPDGTNLSCADHSDCGTYELCQSGRCVEVPCDLPGDSGDDPWRCEQGGECTLKPVAEAGHGAQQWVCSAECRMDSECFEEECLNGPCRFCGPSSRSCSECRPTVEDLGTYRVEYIEGCPDRNSFACEQGSCISECYAFESGQSQYLCDPALEYCNQGRCVLFDWSWADLAPSTFSGMGRPAWGSELSEQLGVTTAISQNYPVKVEAFGVADYLHPPELVLEGRMTGGVYGGGWFELGRVLVYNGTQREAEDKPYFVYTPYPVDEIRARLVLPPSVNYNSGATGLGSREKDFCERPGSWAASDRAACYRRPATSRATLGYQVGRPEHEIRRACDELHARAGIASPCERDDRLTEYLHGGQPAVIITKLEVNKQGGPAVALTRNSVCSYEGGTAPRDDQGPRLVYFGDPSREQSNQRRGYYAAATPDSDLVDFLGDSDGKWALLNCNLNLTALESDPDALAQAVYRLNVAYQKVGSVREGNIEETANGCFVVSGSPPTEVRKPCHEIVGGGASLDYLTHEPMIHKTLDFELFGSFGWDGSARP